MSSDPLMDELRVRFRATTEIRLQEMGVLLDALDRDAGDKASLQKLALHFHALSGMGATYGYPGISRLGEEGESALLPLAAANATFSDRGRWRGLVADIARELRG
jgi:hypothetical protein